MQSTPMPEQTLPTLRTVGKAKLGMVLAILLRGDVGDASSRLPAAVAGRGFAVAAAARALAGDPGLTAFEPSMRTEHA